MMSNSRFVCAAFAVIGVLVAACEKTNDPVATKSPCDEANTSCLEITVTPEEMTYAAVYNDFLKKTNHTLSWNVGSEKIAGYAPGRHIVIKVNFNPPVKARYSHRTAGFYLGAGAVSDCYDRYLNLTASALSTGWPDYWNVIVPGGVCDTGASILGVNVSMMVSTQQPLQSVMVTFVVPDTYTGGRAGTPVLPGDLNVFAVQLIAQLDGDTGPNPPSWQGEYTP